MFEVVDIGAMTYQKALGTTPNEWKQLFRKRAIAIHPDRVPREHPELCQRSERPDTDKFYADARFSSLCFRARVCVLDDKKSDDEAMDRALVRGQL